MYNKCCNLDAYVLIFASVLNLYFIQLYLCTNESMLKRSRLLTPVPLSSGVLWSVRLCTLCRNSSSCSVQRALPHSCCSLTFKGNKSNKIFFSFFKQKRRKNSLKKNSPSTCYLSLELINFNVALKTWTSLNMWCWLTFFCVDWKSEETGSLDTCSCRTIKEDKKQLFERLLE